MTGTGTEVITAPPYGQPASHEVQGDRIVGSLSRTTMIGTASGWKESAVTASSALSGDEPAAPEANGVEALSQLQREVERYGPVAFLVTVNSHGRPHCSSA